MFLPETEKFFNDKGKRSLVCGIGRIWLRHFDIVFMWIDYVDTTSTIAVSWFSQQRPGVSGVSESGEFARVPAEETAIMILSVINGIVRYKKMNNDPPKNLRKAAVDFCRRSLMNGNIEGTGH